MKKSDLVGQKFGRLIVIKEVGRKCGGVTWLCECICGGSIIASSASLNRGDVRSCGCLHRESAARIGRATATTHGQARKGKITTEYRTWQCMKTRCENSSYDKYLYYGGRGIKVCDRWHSFENFLKDMGFKPGKGYSIERENNNDNYEPENCRWATRKEQRLNRRPISTGPKRQCWFRAWDKDKMAQWLSNNQSEFARQHNLSASSVSACLLAKRKTYKGWTFKPVKT